MKLRARVTGAVLVGTLSMMGLAACSSDGGDSSAKDEDTSETSPPSAEDSASAGEDGKPSKDEVVVGYSKIINDTLGESLSEEVVTEIATCFADAVYDDASDQTLQAIADSDVAGVELDDIPLFTDASATCQQQVAGG